MGKIPTYGVTLEFNKANRNIEFDVVEISDDSDYKVFNQIIGSNLIDVAAYDEKYDIVVDDEGLFVSNNPVLEINTPQGIYNLAGKLLFLKKVLTNNGVGLIGMSKEEIKELLPKLMKSVKSVRFTH